MLNKVVCIVGGVLAIGCWGSSASAQQAVMDEFYGTGVHNFYDRDFFQAMQNLSVAIDGGSQDPRAYYYRGLARMRSGDVQGAHADLQKGSALETADVDQFYPVAKSLERIQGSERSTLERYRALARAQARQRQLRRDAVRYEERRRHEAQVLRSVPVGPPPAALGVAPATAVEAPAPADAAPAAAPAAAATPMPPAAGSPFDAPAGAPAEAPTDDPFAPAADAPAAADDPFGATMPADDPAAAEDPFTDDPN